MAVIEKEQAEAGKGNSVLLSQRDYVPSPYREGSWERLQPKTNAENFNPIAVTVMEDDPRAHSTMFESFPGEPRRAPGQTPASPMLPQIDEAFVEAAKKSAAEEAKKQGFQEGVEAGKKEKAKELEAIKAELAAFQAKVTEQLQSFFTSVEKKAVDLSLNVAHRILATTTQARPEYIIDVIRQAVKYLGANKALTIRVSPEDHEFIQVIGLPAELSPAELGVRYVADENVKSGCVVDSEFGEIDLQLDPMWEQVRESIYEATR